MTIGFRLLLFWTVDWTCTWWKLRGGGQIWEYYTFSSGFFSEADEPPSIVRSSVVAPLFHGPVCNSLIFACYGRVLLCTEMCVKFNFLCFCIFSRFFTYLGVWNLCCDKSITLGFEKVPTSKSCPRPSCISKVDERVVCVYCWETQAFVISRIRFDEVFGFITLFTK